MLSALFQCVLYRYYNLNIVRKEFNEMQLLVVNLKLLCNILTALGTLRRLNPLKKE